MLLGGFGGDLVIDLAFDDAPEGHQVNRGVKQAWQLDSSDAENISRYRGATFAVLRIHTEWMALNRHAYDVRKVC